MTYTTSLEMIQETIALEKATGRAVCGEEFPPDDRRVQAVRLDAHRQQRDAG